VSVLLFLAVTFGAGTAAILTRRRPGVSIPIGIAGLAAATVAGFVLQPGDRLQVGETAMVVSEFQRLFLLFGSVAGLAVSIIALTGAWQRNLASAMLLGLGALAFGLGLADPVSRLAATAAAGLPGVLVAISTPVDARGVRAAARELRAVAVTGALAVVAAALVSGPAGLANLSPTIVGLAYLAMALAVAVRIGAIPFHTRVARVTGSAPGAALPLLLAWAPAGFAAAALVWVDWNISTTAIPLEPERLVIAAVGLLCIVLGILAATIQDDIEHVVGYSVIQDAGFVMLALAVLDIAAWEPARSWLLIYVATKSAFAGWALAMRDTFGTGRIGELSGWLRRAPLLGLALAVIVVATVGVPGLLVFDVRSRIASLALGDPLALLAIAGGLGSLLYYGRLARVGIGPVAPMVAAYPGIRPRGLATARAAAKRAAAVAGAEAAEGAASASGPASTSTAAAPSAAWTRRPGRRSRTPTAPPAGPHGLPGARRRTCPRFAATPGR
jgi:NADH:ubiquinone oxidoreductase subunit 2 (subunit N)